MTIDVRVISGIAMTQYGIVATGCRMICHRLVRSDRLTE
jgi:hypothetical protein